MENKLFKQIISENAKKLKFEKFKTSFFRESDDSLLFLIPRKSGYSNKYYLRMKVKLKPIESDFDKNEFIKHDVAEILLSIDGDDLEIFNLENSLADSERYERMENFFKNKVDFWTNKMLSKENIIELNQKNNFFLHPHIKLKLGIE